MSATPAPVVILGYGPAVGDCILREFVNRGHPVAIMARNRSTLFAVAHPWQTKGKDVKPYALDLSKPEDVEQTLKIAEEEMGKFGVCIYNATQAHLPWNATPAEVVAATNINVTSLQVAFRYFLPSWRKEGKGTFMMTGGVFALDGAISAQYGAHFGSANKAFQKNFAESALATFRKDGINVVNMRISSVVFGGKQFQGAPTDPAADELWQRQVGASYYEAYSRCQRDWSPDYAVVPSSMQAVVYEKCGGTDVLSVQEISKPLVGDLDVLVKVAATAVNPVDWKLRKNNWLPNQAPYIPGWDVSGTVVEVGKSVKNFKAGDEIYSYHRPEFDVDPADKVFRNGTAAQFVSIPCHRVALKARNMSFTQVAGIPLAGLTAYQALCDHGQARVGMKVLVSAASGGVGGFALQFLAIRGVHATATCSAKSFDYVKSLGCKDAFDYTKSTFVEDVKAAYPDGFDLVLDFVGGDETNKLMQFVKKGKTIVSIANFGIAEIAAKEGKVGKAFFVSPDAGQLATFSSWLEAGWMVPGEITEFDGLAKLKDAHALSESGRTRGKIVVNVK